MTGVIESDDLRAEDAFMDDPDGDEMSGAIFSSDRLYRYALWRQWSPSPPTRTISFVLLNPSIANATQLDPTLRRCLDFATQWGYDRMNVVNLYAFKATDPKIMLAQDDPSGGAENIAAIRRYVGVSDLCIAAWGSNVIETGRLEWLCELVDPIPVHVLGFTARGEPRHPLYMRSDCGHRAG
jgi:hypothetical protein